MKKTAIIGAGLSGLTCALTLKRYGIPYDLFEKRGMVGDRFVLAEAMFQMLDHPFEDEINHLQHTHHIRLTPSSLIKKLFIYGPSESACIEGNLGYINLRGKNDNAFEQQLKNQLTEKIHYEQEATLTNLSKEYSNVVLASGDPTDTRKLQPYHEAMAVSFEGSIVDGTFDTSEAFCWFNNDIAPKGMGYVLPHSETEASLVLVFPEYEENHIYSKEDLFNSLHAEAQKRLKQNLAIKTKFTVSDYQIGITETPTKDNVYFVGNCFGAITPFLGFGQFTAMLTGIYAGLDISGNGNYNELTKPLYKNYHESLTLRRATESLSNQQIDLVIKALQVKVIGKSLTLKNINPLKILSSILNPFF